jgi:L-threonylcarbamoyladenylate synthase
METIILLQDDPSTLSRAVEIITSGGVVAFPTDTVYGIGTRADSEKAVERLYLIKGRSLDKPIPLMLGDLGQLDKVVQHISPVAKRLTERFWPGPLTLILLKQTGLPINLTAQAGIGVRIPDHPFARALLKQCGPLAVTSANLSGYPEALNAQEAIKQLGGRLELVVDGGDSPGGCASTVVDLTSGQPRIARPGPVTGEMIEQALRYNA